MPKKTAEILSKLSEKAKISLRLSGEVARKAYSRSIKPNHLLIALLINRRSLASRTVRSMGVDISLLVEKLSGTQGFKIEADMGSIVELKLSKEVKEIFREAYSLANRFAHVYVGTEHLMLALLKGSGADIRKVLELYGLNYKTYETALLNFATYPVGILAKPDSMPGNPMDENNSILTMMGYDLVQEAQKGHLDPVIGRDLEVQKMLNILSRRKKNNLVIVGEAGVGKTALVEGLAQRIADGNVPHSLRDVRIIAVDIPSIIAGSKMRGDVEEKMMAIVDEVIASPNTILFIDEIHSILAPSMPGATSDIASILKPALVRDDFRCIGATTTSEYSAYFEEDTGLARRFQPVHIEETSVEDTVKILKRIKPILEAHHSVKISKEAIERAVRLSDRYVSDRYLPDKALDLLDEASATRKLEVEVKHNDIVEAHDELRKAEGEKDNAIKKGEMKDAKKQKEKIEELEKKIKKLEKKRKVDEKSKEFEVDVDTIRSVVSKWTGIPVSTLGDKEAATLSKLEQILEKKVVGQTEAVEAVSSAIKRARVGISAADRPWASFLFLGPTGVGKTELAKVLTNELFGEEDRLIQIDMSELMEGHSISKLIGSPPGYVGYKEGGQLTERVRRNPHSVILFDEIEKAHEDILNVLLQILEYGHLTDSKGRRVNFKNTVIVLTSNIGAEEISKDKVLGFGGKKVNGERTDAQIESAYDSMKEELERKVKETLRPELINRLDDIVIFRSLTRKDARKIVDLLIKELNLRLKEQGVKAKMGRDVKDYIMKEGFSEEYGARPLRRTLQDSVENVIANYLLENGLNLDDLSKGRKMRVLEIGMDKDSVIIKQ